MPTADTFDCPPIAEFVRRYTYGVIVDPFARNSRMGTITNDINPNTNAEYHMDAEAFLKMLGKDRLLADCIILDPPYSPRQISESYVAAGLKATQADTQNAALYARVRNAARALCRRGTRVLSFGWNSCGMGPFFSKVELLLVAHGGAHNDTICLAEECEKSDFQWGIEQAYKFADRLTHGVSKDALEEAEPETDAAVKR